MGGKKSKFSGAKVITIIIVILIVLTVVRMLLLEQILAAIYNIIVQKIHEIIGKLPEIGRQIYNRVIFWRYKAPDGVGTVFYLIDNSEIDKLAGDWSSEDAKQELDNANDPTKTIQTGFLQNQMLDLGETGLDRLLIKEMDVVYNASASVSSTVVLAELDGRINGNTIEINLGKDGSNNDIKFQVDENFSINDIKTAYPELVDSATNKIVGSVDWDNDNKADLVIDSDQDGEPDRGCEVLKVVRPEWYAKAFNLSDERKEEYVRMFTENLLDDGTPNGTREWRKIIPFI